MSNAGKDAEKLNHSLLVGDLKQKTTLGNSLAVPQIIEHTTNTQPGNCTPGHGVCLPWNTTQKSKGTDYAYTQQRHESPENYAE